MLYMKFLIDMGVGKKVEEWFKENGYDVKCVRDINIRSKDADILRLAVSEDRMIITMDKDFGELVYNPGMLHSGVLILRLENARGEDKVDIVERIVTGFSEKIENKFCVYQDGRLRIRE
jgi:predicted nuclease of predicted toxin-antitoxin system